MDLEKLGQEAEDWAREHPERVFIAKSLLMLFVLVFIKYALREVYYIALILLPLFFIGWILMNAFATNTSVWKAFNEYISFIDAPMNFGKDRKKDTAYVTIALIATNFFIFLFIQPGLDYKTILDYYAFPPRINEYWNLPIAVISSVFIHGGFDHIFYNMLFLWVTGSIVEKRIGHKRFFWSYMAAGIFANLFALFVENIYLEKLVPGIGASGAISGVMGLYMVRCYYRDMYFPIASAGMMNFNVKINSFIVIGIYFTKDLRGGLGNIVSGNFFGTGYFCHLGGILTGIAIAYALKLNRDAIEERHRSILTDMTEDNNFNYSIFEEVGGMDGAKTHAEHAMKLDENNHETFLAMARLKTKSDTFVVGSKHKKVGEGKEWYEKAIRIMVDSDHEDALSVFLEYYKQYGDIFDQDRQIKLSLLLYKKGDYELCLNTLEFLLAKKNISTSIFQKALFYSAMCSEKLNLTDHAINLFKDFLHRFPNSELRLNIIEKITILEKMPRIKQEEVMPSDELLGIIKDIDPKVLEFEKSKFNLGACLSPIAWAYSNKLWQIFWICLGIRLFSICIFDSVFVNYMILILTFFTIGKIANYLAWEEDIWTSVEDATEKQKKFLTKSLILFIIFEPVFLFVMLSK